MVRPTQQDVARKAKVSRALVSLVFRDAPNVSPRSRQKVRQAAEELGYRPNALARSLASKEIRTLGVLINDITNPYLATAYEAVSAAAQTVGYDLLVEPGTRFTRESDLINTLLGHQVAGLVLLSPFTRDADLEPLTQMIPTVIIGRGTDITGVDAVTTDELQAARMVVEHLSGLGHTDIVHISGGRNRPGLDRARAFRKAMREAGLEPRVVQASFTEEGGRVAGERLLRDGRLPTAVVGANDLVALGAMGSLRAAGVHLPDDVSVVGYDDSQFASLDLVSLTSVRQAVDEWGQQGLRLLIERVENQRTEDVHQLLEADLVVRGSTTRPPRRRATA